MSVSDGGRMLRVNEVAEILNVSTKTVRRLCERGHLDFRRPASLRAVLIPESAVHSFLDAGRRV